MEVIDDVLQKTWVLIKYNSHVFNTLKSFLKFDHKKYYINHYGTTGFGNYTNSIKNNLIFDDLIIIENNVHFLEDEYIKDHTITWSVISQLKGRFEYSFDKTWSFLILKKNRDILIFKSLSGTKQI